MLLWDCRDNSCLFLPGPELLGGEADGCGLIPEVSFWGPFAPAPRPTSHTGPQVRTRMVAMNMHAVDGD